MLAAYRKKLVPEQRHGTIHLSATLGGASFQQSFHVNPERRTGKITELSDPAGPPSGPSVLYKYRNDSERTEQIFLDRKVWLSPPHRLDDPLECRTGLLSEEWKQAFIRRTEEAQIMGFLDSATPFLEIGTSFYSLSNRSAIRWFRSFYNLKSHQARYARVRSFLDDHGVELSNPAATFTSLDQQLAKSGVFSLSESATSHSMWPLYADNHTGLAIGFERQPGSKLASNRHTFPVVYKDSKPITTEGLCVQAETQKLATGGVKWVRKIRFEDPLFRAAISTKPTEWSYQKEWRYVEEYSGLADLPGPIRVLVFGLKMSPARRRHYAYLASRSTHERVSFYEIRTARDGSGLELSEVG